MVITDLGERIIKLRNSGMSLKRIQRDIKCSRSTVSKWCAVAKDPDIKFDESKRNLGTSSLRLQKEKELLRMMKPDDPSWFNNYKQRLREASKYFLTLPVGHQCQVCGHTKTHNLSFHHKDPLNKKFEISGMRLTYSIAKLIMEAEKCNVVCRNCHGDIHHGNINDKSLPVLNFSNIQIPDSIIQWYYGATGA